MSLPPIESARGLRTNAYRGLNSSVYVWEQQRRLCFTAEKHVRVCGYLASRRGDWACRVICVQLPTAIVTYPCEMPSPSDKLAIGQHVPLFPTIPRFASPLSRTNNVARASCMQHARSL
eukprot:6209702-Pleurochrysis_carterae.AAC.2